MPGAPPMSTRDPCTAPPPSTWSSSPMPVWKRSSSESSISLSRLAWGRLCRPPTAVLALPRTRSEGCSTMVFQLPQAGQRPCHLGNSLPHSVQKKMVFAFIGVTRFRWSAGQVGTHEHHGQLGLIVLLLQQLVFLGVGQEPALHQDGTAVDVVH